VIHVQRVLRTAAGQAQSLAGVSDVVKVFGPAAIHVEQGDLPFDVFQDLAANLGKELLVTRRAAPGQEGRGFSLHQQVPTPLLHDLALPVNDIRILPQGSANLQILAFDDALHVGYLMRDLRIVDRLRPGARIAIGQRHLVNAEAFEQVVLEADDESGRSGITLTAGASSQLIVHSTALMPIRADHVEPPVRDDRVATPLGSAAQPDVGAASGHVRSSPRRGRRRRRRFRPRVRHFWR